MASVKKTFNINLDTKYAETNRKIMLTEGDTGVVFHIVLSDEGKPVDLSGCRVLAVFSNSNGTSSQDSEVLGNGVTIGGDDYNEITIDLKPSRFAAGYNECEIQVYSGDLMGTLITTARFNFSAVPSILNPDSIRDDERYPILLDLIQQVKDLQSGVGDMTKDAYDPDRDGKVLLAEYADRAETAFSADHVGGRDADYFASKAALDVEIAAREALAALVGGISAESIGAEKKRLQFTDAPCYIASFSDDTTYADFPYRGAVDLAGVSADMTPEVVFDIADAMSGSYAPVASCYNGGVFIYAAEKPSDDFTIPTIICWKAVG